MDEKKKNKGVSHGEDNCFMPSLHHGNIHLYLKGFTSTRFALDPRT